MTKPKPSPGALLLMEAILHKMNSPTVTDEQLDNAIAWVQALVGMLRELKLKRGLG